MTYFTACIGCSVVRKGSPDPFRYEALLLFLPTYHYPLLAAAWQAVKFLVPGEHPWCQTLCWWRACTGVSQAAPRANCQLIHQPTTEKMARRCPHPYFPLQCTLASSTSLNGGTRRQWQRACGSMCSRSTPAAPALASQLLRSEWVGVRSGVCWHVDQLLPLTGPGS